MGKKFKEVTDVGADARQKREETIARAGGPQNLKWAAIAALQERTAVASALNADLK